MRPFESILIVGDLLVVVWLAFSSGRISFLRTPLASLLLFVALLQVVVEGYRWQMLPAYFATLVTIFILYSPVARFDALQLAGAGGLALSGLATIIYPVFDLPRPTGPYQIGTVTYHLIDSERRELFSLKPDARRELMIQIWYPAVGVGSQSPEPYRISALTSLQYAYLRFVKTHTYSGVPIANSSVAFPVVFFTPSWHGLRNQELAVVEELVSHGFVVVGVDHPYGSGVTLFPDGRKIVARPVPFMDTSSELTMEKSREIAEKEVRLRALDLVFALNELEKINRADRLGVLTGRLDLGRVGILGYSFGGAVAVESCWLDSRFRCAADLDGALFGGAAKMGIEQPLLVMTDSLGPPPNAELTSKNASRRRWAQFEAENGRMILNDLHLHGGFLAEIPGVGHANFCDASLESPVRWLSGSGAIDPRRALDIVRGVSLVFFQFALDRQPAQLVLNEAARFPEVSFTEYSAAPQRVGQSSPRTRDSPTSHISD
jgi:dienelactone hydrolase